MIEKCPHCNRDVVFSRDICPACGFTAKDSERGESTYMGEAARLGLAAAYVEEMETRLNATQRRGRLQTGLIIGLLLAPLVVYNVVGLYWLRFSFAWFVVLALTAWACRKLWDGSRPLRFVLGGLAGAAGLWSLVECAIKRFDLNPVRFLAYLVFGAVYVWCAWILLRSRDIPEWLDYQSERRRFEGY